MSGRGGKRAGAGRPKGSVSKKTREISERALKEGISPLEVMLEAMREAYGKRDLSEAARYAEKAAPYCHARFSSIEHGGAGGGPIQFVISKDDGDL